MKIIILFITAVSCLVINKALGFSNDASIFGAMVGSCSYVLLQIGKKS